MVERKKRMIDTDSLLDNEKSKGATETNIVTVPKNMSINKQDDSGKASSQTGNIFIRLFNYFRKKKQLVQSNMPEKAKIVMPRFLLSQEQKQLIAILNGNTSLVCNNHVIKVRVLSSEMLPKEFVNLIANSPFLLTHLKTKYIKQMIMNVFNYFVVTRNNINWTDKKQLVGQSISQFFNALVLNNNIKEAINNSQSLANLLYLYKCYEKVDNKPNETMNRLLPLILQKSYQHYDELSIYSIKLLDSLTSNTSLRQNISLFGAAIIVESNFISYVVDREYLRGLKVKTLNTYYPDYLLDLRADQEPINKRKALKFKCYSKKDLYWAIDFFAFTLQYIRQEHLCVLKEVIHAIENLLPNIHLNGYRKLVAYFADTSEDKNIKTVCQILLKASD